MPVNLSRNASEEAAKFLHIASLTGECRNYRAVGPEEGIVRDARRAISFYLQCLVAFADLIKAVGIQFDQDHVLNQFADLRLREHVCLHPLAVRAGVAREAYQQGLALRLGRCHGPFVVVLDPVDSSGLSGRQAGGGCFWHVSV